MEGESESCGEKDVHMIREVDGWSGGGGGVVWKKMLKERGHKGKRKVRHE